MAGEFDDFSLAVGPFLAVGIFEGVVASVVPEGSDHGGRGFFTCFSFELYSSFF